MAFYRAHYPSHGHSERHSHAHTYIYVCVCSVLGFIRSPVVSLLRIPDVFSQEVTALIRANVALNFAHVTGTAQHRPPVVSAAPLVWGEASEEVKVLDPEVVVMSDVVYDPAGKC